MERLNGSENRVKHRWTKEEKEYLSEITPGRHYKEIIEMMNDKFEYQFTYEQVKSAILRFNLKTGFNGRFEKGHVPANKGTKGIMKPNKTSFKKGNVNWAKKPIGSERVSVDGYTEIKVAGSKRWRLKHRVMYEKYHNVVLNPKQLVIFADGDKSNMSKENLLLVDNNQLLILNQNGLINENRELTKTGLNIANIIIKLNELKR